ncbi:MAG TPA: DUF2203 domain-containing protein [Bryobacteraceae bacterium]|nr:DUF2203 domain-containing protein [Bryobacteraceae bacterium]
MAKRFTLWEAERMIPQVREWLEEALALKSQYDEADHAMQSLTERIMLMGGIVVDRQSAAKSKMQREESGQRLRAILGRFEESGCLVKDLDIGLVDFPTLFHGEEVYLCWKLGEDKIAFWHGTQEGFAGRKAIDQDFLDHHEGEQAN